MYRNIFIRRALLVPAVITALGLAACGGQTGHNGHSGDTSKKDFNDADVMFAQMMIPHHEQAVEMSELAATRAGDAEVSTIAGEIEAAQDPEITTMTGWLKDWDQPTHMEHDMGSADGMADDADLRKLKDSKGAAFDKLFVKLMIAHHSGAVDMADDERENGKNSAARKLAKAIVATQSDEIDDLNAMAERL